MSFKWADDVPAKVVATDCDKQPIHAPGAIQDCGFLISANLNDLQILQISTNISDYLGQAAEDLLNRPLETILPRRVIARLLKSARRSGRLPLLEGEAWTTENTRTGKIDHYQLVAHFKQSRLIIEGTRDSTHTTEATVLYNEMAQHIASLSSAGDLDTVCRVAAEHLQGMTSFDRVMVYRFDEHWHGKVIAEVVETGVEQRFLGLHFPSIDIPAQARQLYLVNRTRGFYDCNSRLNPLIPERDPLTAEPLDLSFSHLRAAAPSHIEYLRNMGVRASFSVSIIVDNKLWGLIVCHQERQPKFVSLAIRQNSVVAASVLAAQVTRLSSARYNTLVQQLRALLDDMSYRIRDEHIALIDAVTEHEQALCELFGAHNLVICVRDKKYAKLPPVFREREISVLKKQAQNGMLMTDRASDLPGMPANTALAGVLFISLSPNMRDYLLIQRNEQVSTKEWGGNPKDHIVHKDEQGLHPRQNFESWREKVRGASLPFAPEDLDLLRTLRHALVEYYALEEKHIASELLQHQANFDALTQLANRHSFDIELRKMFLRQGLPPESFALAFIDLDNFKHVNDTMGHPVGDCLLCEVANRFQKVLDPGDFLARLSGDEFTAILRTEKSLQNIAAVAESLLSALETPFEMVGGRFYIGASIGLAIAIQDGTDAASLMRSADLAMYQAKQLGKNRYAFFSPALIDQMEVRVSMQNQLRDAIDRDEFVYYFQPIVDAHSKRVLGAEALVRWQHPTRGLLKADSFYQVAEELDIMSRIDEHGALSLLHVMQSFLDLCPDFRLSINTSVRAFYDDSFQRLIENLQQQHAPFSSLNFEITESALLENTDKTLNMLNRAIELGANIYIDDFGTGYGSLSYINKYPVSGLKIDQSFVRGMIDEKKSAALVKGVAAMAEGLDLEVIAEGVETEAQQQALLALGVSMQQGYYYDEAIDFVNFKKQLTDQRVAAEKIKSVRR